MGRNITVDEEWHALAVSLCFKDERHMYEVMYEQEGHSVKEIAERLKCGTATLNRRMSAFKIKKKSRGGAHKNGDKRALLFYLDQRLIMALSNKSIGELWDMSYSMAYNYKRWKAAGSMVGFHLSSVGTPNAMEDVRI